MNMFRAIAAVAALTLSLGAPAARADSISLGTPAYGGTGCPAGSAAAVLSPDQKSLSILFDNYVAQAGGGKSFDRKSCNLAVPVHVPQGYSVSVLAIDYRGYNNIPAGAKSVFRVEYFFAGGTGPVFNKTFNGPKNDDYLITNSLTQSGTVWSACGADVNLRVNSSIRVTTVQNKDAIATVDTADVKAAIVYKLQWKKC